MNMKNHCGQCLKSTNEEVEKLRKEVRELRKDNKELVEQNIKLIEKLLDAVMSNSKIIDKENQNIQKTKDIPYDHYYPYYPFYPDPNTPWYGTNYRKHIYSTYGDHTDNGEIKQ